MKPIYCVKCNSQCAPPQGISNTVVCKKCGYIFEVMRGALREETNTDKATGGPAKGTSSPRVSASPALTPRPLQVVPKVKDLPTPVPLPPEPPATAQDEEEKVGVLPQWLAEEQEKPRAMPAIKKKPAASESNAEVVDEDAPASKPSTAKNDDDDEKKGRFALQRPENLLYETYAAPLKDVQEILAQATDKTKKPLPPDVQDVLAKANSNAKKPLPPDVQDVLARANKQSLSQVAARSKDNKTARVEPKPDAGKLQMAAEQKKASMVKSKPVETKPIPRRKLSDRLKDSFMYITRPAFKVPKAVKPTAPIKAVKADNCSKPKSRGGRILRLFLMLVSLAGIYVLSMAPVVCYFPKPPAWVDQFYYPVKLLKDEVPWLQEYQAWWATIIKQYKLKAEK